MIRKVHVELPSSLRVLVDIDDELWLSIEGPITQRTILDALERLHPTLQGTIRDRTSKRRRPLVRFFACRQDLSHTNPDDPLPALVATGAEPFVIVGAIAGG